MKNKTAFDRISQIRIWLAFKLLPPQDRQILAVSYCLIKGVYDTQGVEGIVALVDEVQGAKERLLNLNDTRIQ